MFGSHCAVPKRVGVLCLAAASPWRGFPVNAEPLEKKRESGWKMPSVDQ